MQDLPGEAYPGCFAGLDGDTSGVRKAVRRERPDERIKELRQKRSKPEEPGADHATQTEKAVAGRHNGDAMVMLDRSRGSIHGNV
jgi:hypothetical protein